MLLHAVEEPGLVEELPAELGPPVQDRPHLGAALDVNLRLDLAEALQLRRLRRLLPRVPDDRLRLVYDLHEPVDHVHHVFVAGGDALLQREGALRAEGLPVVPHQATGADERDEPRHGDSELFGSQGAAPSRPLTSSMRTSSSLWSSNSRTSTASRQKPSGRWRTEHSLHEQLQTHQGTLAPV